MNILTDEEIFRCVPEENMMEEIPVINQRTLDAAWQLFDAAWQLYDAERRASESLRQQLAASQDENESLRRANKECVEYFNDMQKDLAAANAEIERLKTNAFERTNQLIDGMLAQASIQACGMKLREALEVVNNAGDDEWYPYTPEQAKKAIGEALALPQDTSALEAMIQKAGEVMRERVMQARGKGQLYPMDIRAIPGVTLVDLRK